MSTWIVSVHSGGGSMSEAVDPLIAYEVPDEDAAKELAGKASDFLSNHPDSYVQREIWATYYQAAQAPANVERSLTDVLADRYDT